MNATISRQMIYARRRYEERENSTNDMTKISHGCGVTAERVREGCDRTIMGHLAWLGKYARSSESNEETANQRFTDRYRSGDEESVGWPSSILALGKIH